MFNLSNILRLIKEFLYKFLIGLLIIVGYTLFVIAGLNLVHYLGFPEGGGAEVLVVLSPFLVILIYAIRKWIVEGDANEFFLSVKVLCQILLWLLVIVIGAGTLIWGVSQITWGGAVLILLLYIAIQVSKNKN